MVDEGLEHLLDEQLNLDQFRSMPIKIALQKLKIATIRDYITSEKDVLIKQRGIGPKKIFDLNGTFALPILNYLSKYIPEDQQETYRKALDGYGIRITINDSIVTEDGSGEDLTTKLAQKFALISNILTKEIDIRQVDSSIKNKLKKLIGSKNLVHYSDILDLGWQGIVISKGIGRKSSTEIYNLVGLPLLKTFREYMPQEYQELFTKTLSKYNIDI